MARAKGGESVRGYKLIRDFKMAGGGNCEWTFAIKDGKEYFIKVFLNPKYPKPDGPGSEKTKTIMREECERFERHQRELNDAVKKVAGAGGRLVASNEFFKEDNLFYKVAVKVPAAPITPKEIAALNFGAKIRLLQNVCTAVSSLHQQRIVHGDLKIDNALLEKGSGDEPFIARLIDFDSSYFSEKPPIVDEMMGDPPYYSPELLNYVQKLDDDPSKLTTKSDIFALGVVFHQYLAGEMPEFPDAHKYLCEAVRSGHAVTPDSLKVDESSGLAALIASMLQLDPESRPSSFKVQNFLRELRKNPDFVLPAESGKTATTHIVSKTDDSKPRPGLRGSGMSTPKPSETVDVVVAKDEEPVTPEVALKSPSTYELAIANLVKSLTEVDNAVAAKIAPVKATSRIKGTLANPVKTLRPDEAEVIEDIQQRLTELQQHTNEVVRWLTGEILERPSLRIRATETAVDSSAEIETASERKPL